MPITQDMALTILAQILGGAPSEAAECTGVAETCPVEECMICSVRECPHNEPLHFHHDGCPACWQDFQSTQVWKD